MISDWNLRCLSFCRAFSQNRVLSKLVHGATIVRDSATHSGIVGCEGSVWRIAPLQFLTSRSFLGAPLPELLLCAPFLGVHPAALVAVAALALLA
jgi:hypothetical protein